MRSVLPAQRLTQKEKEEENEKLQEQQKKGEEKQQEQGAAAGSAEGDKLQAPEQGARGAGRCDSELLGQVPARFGNTSDMHTHADTHSARVKHPRDPQCPQFCKSLHVHHKKAQCVALSGPRLTRWRCWPRRSKTNKGMLPEDGEDHNDGMTDATLKMGM